MGSADRAHQFLRASNETDPVTGHGMGLGGPVQNQGLVRDEFGNGSVATVVDQLRVNFVSDYDQVSILDRLGERLDLVMGVGDAGWVGWVVQN